MASDIATRIHKFSSQTGIDALTIHSGESAADIIRNFTPEYIEYKTIVTAALSYNYSWNSVNSDIPGYIAHYTTANFYKLLKDNLKKTGVYAAELHGITSGFKHWGYLSVNGKLPEKELALHTRLGIQLSNSLISPDTQGTYYVIGVMLLKFTIDTEPIPESSQGSPCQNCGLCIQACPTGALLPEKRLIKEKCLQHLSSCRDIDLGTVENILIPHWNSRFYGCTACIDICPLNAKQPVKDQDFPVQLLPGYIGTYFNADMSIASLQSGEFQKQFTHNQLSAGWIDEAVLLRNMLFARFGIHGNRGIMEFEKELNASGFTKDTKEYLRNIINIIKNNKGI